MADPGWLSIFGVVAILCLAPGASVYAAQAQDAPVTTTKPPKPLLRRAEEDYFDRAKDDAALPSFKRIGSEDGIRVSVGGELRFRGEFFDNRNWRAGDDDDIWSHRATLHARMRLSENLQLFGEVYHGYTSGGERPANSDRLGLHQAFAEYNWPSDRDRNVQLRIGRQELGFGKARLVGIREWPNIRRSFDAVRLLYSESDYQVQAFYGREVQLGFGVFDNQSDVFDSDPATSLLSGIHARIAPREGSFQNEVYILHFEAPQARFNDVVDAERRTSLGWRSLGAYQNGLTFDAELTYQFGRLNASEIRAWRAELDASYKVSLAELLLTPGLHLQWSSGDDQAGDGEIGTYNPLFVNPAPYGLSRLITPANVQIIQPYFRVKVSDQMSLYFEYAHYRRESEADGLYRIPRFFGRASQGVASRVIGDQFGFEASYQMTPYWSLNLNAAVFRAGSYLKQSGDSENVTYIVPSLRFRF